MQVEYSERHIVFEVISGYDVCDVIISPTASNKDRKKSLT
jgi:hypothetical protein